MASTEECHLLSLLPEMRNMIWNLALAEEKPIGIHFDFGDDEESRIVLRNTNRARSGLLLANHQIREEALSIFYAVNTFRCDKTGTARFFLRGLAIQNVLGCLTCLKLYITEGLSFTGRKFRDYDKAHSGLERLTRTMVERFVPKGVASGAIKMPIRFRRPSSINNRVKWIALGELKKYELKNDGRNFYFLEREGESS